MNPQHHRSYAIHRIRARRQLAAHLLTFVVMSAFFVLVWAQTGAPTFWPIWAILGWALGLGAHAVHVIGWSTPIDEDAIQREIERIR